MSNSSKSHEFTLKVKVTKDHSYIVNIESGGYVAVSARYNSLGGAFEAAFESIRDQAAEALLKE